MESIESQIDRFDFRHVHPRLLFGTASDRYAGWIGQIYSDAWSSEVKKRSRRLGGRSFEERTVPVATAEEYFEHFNVLEIDFTFYRALRSPAGAPSNNYFVLQQYADAAPDAAKFLLKAPQQVTARTLRRGGSGKPVYEENSDFLNRSVFLGGFVDPAREILGDRLCGVLFEQEYQRKSSAPDPEENIAELDDFFEGLQADVPIHLELRSPHLLIPPYFDWLAGRKLGFVFSHWTWLPPIREQWAMSGERFTAGAHGAVCRLLTPLRMQYAKAYELAHPFDRPVPELSESKQAEAMVLDTAALSLQALKHDTAAMIISNNRAWGNAPSLAQKVARRVLEELEKEGAL
jgi:uncharacterized protein YecE (DUF72 family)